MERPRVLVLTGAGISAKPGVRTFRAAGGLQEERRVKNVAIPEGFSRSPELVQLFYNTHCHQLQQPGIQPSAAYTASVKLEAKLGDCFLLVTQNIDNLHERMSSQNVIHMHGELLKVRCSQGGQTLEWTGDVIPEGKYYCCRFPASLQLHAVWFGEVPLGMDEIYIALAMTDVLIAIGVLGHTYPAAGFVHEVRLYGAHMVEFDLEPSQVGSKFEGKYYSPINQVVSEFVEKLLGGL